MKNLICFVLALTLVGVGGCRRRNATPTPPVNLAQATDDSPEERRRKLLEQNRGKGDPAEPTKSPPISSGPSIILPAKKSDKPKEPTSTPPKSTGPGIPGILQPLKEPKQITNSVGMKLNYIPPGKFLMGTARGNSPYEYYAHEYQHEVELTTGFHMGVYEVTQEQYQAIMGINPSYFKGAKLPVETVSWHQAKEFCAKLSAKEGKTYRLPTEAEWEYACRAGMKVEYLGVSKFRKTTKGSSFLPYQWSGLYDTLGNFVSEEVTQVGSLAPNAWGLHDMLGNVFEWCEDCFDAQYYTYSRRLDPVNVKGGSDRVVRGGLLHPTGVEYSATNRAWSGPGFKCNSLGFRVVAVPSSRDPEQGNAGTKSGEESRQITNSIGMKLADIPPGTFLMGSPNSQKWRRDDEFQHEVELTNGFYMGVYEVTQEEYQAIMGANPSHIKGAKLPVESVSWHDAQAFCKKLSAKEGKTYRLPTEAEWEYACRAGSTTTFHFGESIRSNQATCLGGKTAPVDSGVRNEWGLHNMHGNVWEWCEDCYDPQYYKKSPKQDPLNNNNQGGSARVIRGGGSFNFEGDCTASRRQSFSPDYSHRTGGFRVVAVPSSREPEQGKAGGKSGTE